MSLSIAFHRFLSPTIARIKRWKSFHIYRFLSPNMKECRHFLNIDSRSEAFWWSEMSFSQSFLFDCYVALFFFVGVYIDRMYVYFIEVRKSEWTEVVWFTLFEASNFFPFSSSIKTELQVWIYGGLFITRNTIESSFSNKLSGPFN